MRALDYMYFAYLFIMLFHNNEFFVSILSLLTGKIYRNSIYWTLLFIMHYAEALYRTAKLILPNIYY